MMGVALGLPRTMVVVRERLKMMAEALELSTSPAGLAWWECWGHRHSTKERMPAQAKE